MDHEALLAFIRDYRGRDSIKIDDRNAELRAALFALLAKRPELAPPEVLSDLVHVQSRNLNATEVHMSNFVDVLSHSMEHNPLGGVSVLTRCVTARSQDVDGTLHGRLRLSESALAEATDLLDKLMASRGHSPYWKAVYEYVRDDYLAWVRERESRATDS